MHHKILAGLWFVQECRRIWERRAPIEFDDLDAAAANAPRLQHLFDTDDPRFLNPADMPAAIDSWFRERGLTPPEGVGAITRAIYDSLALNRRMVVDGLERPGERRIEEINLLGGVQSRALAQATADALGVGVVAGPQEAAVAGNLLCQLFASGRLKSLAAGREVIRRSTVSSPFAHANVACGRTLTRDSEAGRPDTERAFK